jgi:hypothetical protein
MLLQYNRLDKKSVIDYIINLIVEFNFPEDVSFIFKKDWELIKQKKSDGKLTFFMGNVLVFEIIEKVRLEMKKLISHG